MNYNEKKRFLNSFEIAELRLLELEKEYALNPADCFKIEMDELTERLSIIKNIIEQISDRHIKTMLDLHYIGEGTKGNRKKYLLWEIGNKLNYSLDWVKKAHSKAIHEIQIPCKTEGF